MRFDKYLQQYIQREYQQDVSRNFVSSLIAKGLFSVKGMVVKKKSFLMLPEAVVEYNKTELQKHIKAYFGLQDAQVISQQWHRSETPQQIKDSELSTVLPKNQIKLENDDYMVVYKPSGVYSHPGRGSFGNDIVTQTLMYLQQQGLYSYRDLPRGGLVHRLDRATRGLLIFAKHRQAYNYFRTLFDEHTIDKYYWAECEVTTKGLAFIKQQQLVALMVDPLESNKKEVLEELIKSDRLVSSKSVAVQGFTWRSRGDHRQMVFSFRDQTLKKSKKSSSTFWLLSQQNDRVQLLIKIHTGRTHQIRTQCRAIGLPIVNDPLYGKVKLVDTTLLEANGMKDQNKAENVVNNVSKISSANMQLVAFWLSFVYEKQPVTVECVEEL